MSNNKKNTIVYFLGTVFLTILNFITSLLYSNMFDPDSYGRYSIVFSIYSLVSQILVGWIAQSTIRYYKKENKKNMITSVLLIHLIFSLFIVLSTNISLSFVSIDSSEKIMYFIFSIIFFFETFLAFVNSILRSENNSKQYSINVNLNSFFKITVLLFVYYILNYKSIVALTISLLVSEIIQTVYLYKKLKLHDYISIDCFDWKLFKKMFKYGFPLMGVAITSWVLNVSDRFIISYFYDSSAVGLYSYSYILANNLISLIMQFIMLGAYPHIVSTWTKYGKEETERVISKYLKLYSVIILPICFGFILMSKYFFTLFTNYMYHESYMNFIITGIAIAVLGYTQYTNKTWELLKKTHVILILNIVAALVNIVLNFILIPKYGYICGSITTLISFSVYLLVSLIISHKRLSIKIVSIDFIKIMLACCIFSGYILLLNRVLDYNNIVNFSLAIITTVILYAILIISFKVIDFNEIKNIKNSK